MARYVNLCLMLVLTLLSAQDAFGWGSTGHRVVGRIADNHLTPEARAGLKSLLGLQTLAEVSTWADEIRSDPSWDHASTWHWVTIEDGETYVSSPKNPAGDLIDQTRKFIAVLGDGKAPVSERGIALKWLAHLVGDIHQPLHVGRGPDRGGNEIDAEWFGRSTNMHRIWDSEMIDSTRLSFSELAAFIDHPSAQDVQRWQQSSVVNWAVESMDYRQQVYSVPESAYVYSYHNLPLVRQRLLQAGVRLAGVVNAAFGSP